jgi:hypothetical protein
MERKTVRSRRDRRIRQLSILVQFLEGLADDWPVVAAKRKERL